MVAIICLGLIEALFLFLGGTQLKKDEPAETVFFSLIGIATLLLVVGIVQTRFPNGLPKTSLKIGAYHVQVVPNLPNENQNMIKILVKKSVSSKSNASVTDYYIPPRNAFENGVPPTATALIVSEKTDYRGKKSKF